MHRPASVKRTGMSFLFSLGLGLHAFAGGTPPDLTGTWATPAKAKVQISRCGSAPCGKLLDFPPPPGQTIASTRDVNNRDASKQHRKLKGLTVLWRMQPNGNTWQGRAYDPRRGFSAKTTLRLISANRMEVKGCVRVLIQVCETETWTRID